jgi:hypothetical protein
LSIELRGTWETLLEDFELFFVGLPDNVRDDLSFMMVVLSDESFVVREVGDVYERALQGLLRANTRMGRVGNLIRAVSVLDVYFALNVRDRFGPQRRSANVPNASASRGPYTEEIDAIKAAKRHWLELRATKFTPAAIAAALIPTASPPKGTRLSHTSNGHGGQFKEIQRGAAS